MSAQVVDAMCDAAILLGRDGPFAQGMAGFAPRAEQQTMARAVQEAIQNTRTLVAEAGTGTGKTYAYLVPALLSGKRIIISTGTKALQDQLYFRDLPRVASLLALRPKSALLKGRANYLCHYRLDQTVHEGARLDDAMSEQLAAIRAWSAHTLHGDRMELGEVPEESPLWQRVTSTSDNCLGTNCPFVNDCHVNKARRKAMNADLVVVNHHLLFADLALKQDGFGDILPGAQAFILDEAHQVPELAGQFFSQSVTARQLSDLMHDSLRACHGVTGAIALLQKPVDILEQALRTWRVALESLPMRGSLEQCKADTQARQGMERLREQLKNLSTVLATQAGRSSGLARMHERAQGIEQRLAHIVETTDKQDVRWYERTRWGFGLHATPLELATPLRTWRERLPAAWIHVSATLSVAQSFKHFNRQMGLDDPQTLRLDSPFNYAMQSLCYLPTGLPDPNAPDYTDRVLDTVLGVLEVSCGRAFLLFTSHRALQYAANRLSECTAWSLFVQGSAPRHQLLEAFRQSAHGVLLGAASFWEGVDVVGEALSVVVIDRLPFATLDDPVLQARLEALKSHGINPFMGWQLPGAVIALKQGVGRLIRDIHDRGVLVLCDPRLSSRSYGRLFLASLPPMPRTRELANVVEFFT